MKKVPTVLHIQEMLRGGKTFTELAYSYDLEVQTHPKFPTLVWFGNRDCDFQEAIVRQCRGLILDMNDNWKVAARPLDHIFEWSAPGCPKLKWPQGVTSDHATAPRVLDKVDGKMVYMYFYDGWQIGSHRNIDASEVPKGYKTALSSIFWGAFYDLGYIAPPAEFQGCTFQWEIEGPLLAGGPSSVDKLRLTLIAIRNNATGEEVDPLRWCRQTERNYRIAYHDMIAYANTAEVLAATIDMGLRFTEGYMLVDADFNRVAVTHPEYNTCRAFRKALSLEWIVDNVRHARPRPLAEYAPDWIPLQVLVARAYADLIERVAAARDRHDRIIDNVLYVNATAQYPFAQLLRKLRFKEFDKITDGLKELHWTELVELLELPEDRASLAA